MEITRVPNLVSIVVPVYNTLPFLSECLNSLTNQTYKDIEIIIIDDNSTDGCEEFIQQWRGQKASVLREDRFIYLKLPRNTKQPGSATTGLFLARGEFIACQASDDLAHPNRLEKQLDFLFEHTDVEMVGTRYANFSDGHFEKQSYSDDWLVFGREEIRKSYALGRHCVCDGTVMMRGSAFDRIGGWTRRMQGVSDFEFIGRYVSSGVVTENIPAVLYYYRIHEGQTTQRLGRGEHW